MGSRKCLHFDWGLLAEIRLTGVVQGIVKRDRFPL